MKNCPKCNNSCDDGAVFCNQCGNSFNPSAYQAQPQQVFYADPTDHTAEFDKADISNNKVLAMVPYLMSWVGIIVALLAINNSPYVAFHVKQVLKLSVVEILLGIVSLVLSWTFIVPIAGAVCLAILFVIRIIGFFSVCSGKAKELAIIKNLNFLK